MVNKLAYGLNPNNFFNVKNISTDGKTLKVLGLNIPYNQTKDLMTIKGVADCDIRISLIKGLLRDLLVANKIEVVNHNLHLTNFSAEEREFLQSKNIEFIYPNSTDIDAVELGNISGNVDLDLREGTTFIGTVVGNTTFAIKNAYAGTLFVVDLTMGGSGNYTLAWDGDGGYTMVDPSGVLAQIFSTTTPGARSVGLWFAGGRNHEVFYAMGYNAS